MGISERKEREKQEMRDRIIAASMKMFVEQGYEKTSIRNIAEKIEYSPATIYLYYKDKDELLYDVQGLAFEKLLEAFQKQAVSKSPMKRLEQICETYVNFGLEHEELYALMFIIRAPMNTIEEEESWSNGESAFDFFADCVKECIDKGLIRYKDVATAMLSIWGMGHGLVSLDVCYRYKIMHLGDQEMGPVIQNAIREFLKMIKA
jgi:AcrR family transcriptional regulator